jgi:hypothetical protein
VRRLCLAISLCVAAGGCGSGVIKNDVSGPAAACYSTAYAACSRLSQCQAGVSVDSCAQQLSNKAKCSTFNCGTAIYSPTAAQACLDAFNNQPCPDAIFNVLPTTCQQGICMTP